MEQQIEFNFRDNVKRKVNELKGNWLALANDLKEIWSTKLYIDYGYDNFESYCIDELKILPTFAKNMVKNYQFLENERTELTSDKANEQYSLPPVEAITVLRNAHKAVNKKISYEHYQKLENAGIDNCEPTPKVQAMLRDFKDEYANKTQAEKIVEKRKKEIDKLLKDLDRINIILTTGKKKHGLSAMADDTDVSEDTRYIAKKLIPMKIDELKGYLVDELESLINVS